MNKKMFSLVLVSSLLVLWMLSSLFIVFAGVVPEDIVLEENRLVKQDFANVANSCNRQYSSLRGDGEGISMTETAASPAALELYYDDGIAEVGHYWSGAGGMYAVRFTPSIAGRLMECSFYIYNNPATIKVHVLDTNKNDRITSFPETPTSTGWFHVDLSTYGITVSPGVDFYVAMNSTVANAPSIGTDESNPDGRSWNHNKVSWSQMWDRDYMIRVLIEPLADLKIYDVYWEPSWPSAGDDVTFKAKVENQGNADATDFEVKLYLDEESIASGTFSLTAGVNTTYFYEGWTATFGNHIVKWVIDATNVIDELNEDNNEMSKELIIGYYLTVGSPYGTPGGQGWYDNSTNAYATLDTSIVDHGNGTRRVFTHWSEDASGTNYTQSDPIYMDGPKTATANWKTQYYLTVNSAQGTPSGAGWYDSGTTASATVSQLTVDGATGTRYAFTGWSGDASGATSPSDAIIMSGPKTATANWKTQYSLTVSSAYGTVGGEGWYDSGDSAYAAVPQLTVAGDTGTQYVFTSWNGDASGTDSTSDAITMSGPKKVTANWKTQYYLNMSTNFGSVSPDSGWHDAGSTVTISATTSAGSGEQHVWNSWTGTGSGSYTGTDNQASVTMNGAVTEVASWTKQYYLTVTSPYGSPTPVSGWFDAGTSIPASVSSPVAGFIVTEYVCTGWAGTGSVPASGTATSVSFTIDQPSSITWNWKTEYLLTNLLLIIIVPVAFAGLAVYLLLRRRQKGKDAGGAPELTLPPPPPPPAKAEAPEKLETPTLTPTNHVFISHVVEDAEIASEIAQSLEKAGYKTWYYERNSVVGLSYLLQTKRAIEQSQAVVLLISPDSLSSTQITKEVIRTHEAGKPFIPLLLGISHIEFQQRQPEWREAIGSATSISIPKQGVSVILPRIINGLASLGVKKSGEFKETPT